MGGSKAGDFGNTSGNALDTLSDLLTLASLIPGLDTFVDLAAIPVDLLRGDYLSAALDALGVIPIIGEAGDTLKLAKLADKTIDASKLSKAIKEQLKVKRAIEQIQPNKLVRTHKLTLSRKKISQAVRRY